MPRLFVLARARCWRLCKLCCWLLCLTCSGGVHSASLADLVFSARARDPAMAIAQAQVKVAKARASDAARTLLPTATITGTTNDNRYSQNKIPYQRFSTEQWAIQVSQQLFHLSTGFATRSAEKIVDQAEAQLAAAESELAGRVASAWFDVITSQEVLKAIRGQKEATQQQLLVAKRSFELGAVSVADVREVEAKHAVVLVQEAQALGDLSFKQQSLSQLTATPIEAIDVAPWMKPQLAAKLGKLEDWLEQAQLTSPSILQARYQVEAAHFEVSRARAVMAPSVDIIANRNLNDASGSNFNDAPAQNESAQLGIQVSIPLTAGLTSRGKINEAIALKDKSLGERDQAYDQVMLNIKQAYVGLSSALAQIPALETAQQANEVSVKASRRGYEVGMRANVDVLNALAQLFQTEKDLAKARADAWLNYMRLRFLTGQWTEADLHAF